MAGCAQGAARYDGVDAAHVKPPPSQKTTRSRRTASPKAPVLQLASGDQIHHKTFGDGMVVSVVPMGGDALIEVAFDTVGTKKADAENGGGTYY